MNLLWDPDPEASERYGYALGPETERLDSEAMVSRALHDNADVRQVIVGPGVALATACQLAQNARLDRLEVGFILIRRRVDVSTMTSALRSGIREVVAATDQSALADALARSSELTARMLGQHGGRLAEGHIVTVFSAKGGVGKTTVATNLGVLLAQSGVKTLLIDLDLSFGDVAISLQLVPQRSVFDAVALSGTMDEDALASLVTTHPSTGLDVLCAPNDPSDADRVPVAVVTEILKVARRRYDYVVVDSPPSFTDHVLAACDVSSALILLATLDIPAVKNLRIALDTLDLLGSPKEGRIIVLNRADAQVGLRAEDVVSAIRAPIALSIPTSTAVPSSVNRGVALVVDQPRDPVSQALRLLADVHVRRRFEGSSEPAHRAASPRRSAWLRWWR